MYIKKLELHNYRIFENLELDFNNKCSVIVGINGSGKTTILEATSVAIGTIFLSLNGVNRYGLKKSDAHRKRFSVGSNIDVEAQYPISILASGSINDKDVTWERTLNSEKGSTTITGAKELTNISDNYQKQLQNGDTSLILPIIAYYGTGRLWDYHKEKSNNAFLTNTRTNGYINCLDGTANIKLMMNWFKKMTIQKYQRQEKGFDDLPELDTVYHAMEDCLASFTGYKNIKINYSLDINELEVSYEDNNNQCVHLPLSLFSDGFKEIISIVADIAYRMAVLNPQLLDEVLTKTDGVVLIDEIDLHLHPAWQQCILEELTKVFPRVQFIVTSHAPAVINSVKEESLIILKDMAPISPSSQTYGKDVNSVLREIMETNERPKKIVDLFNQFYKRLENRDFDGAEEILNILDELRSFHDPEIASCRTKLRLERIRGGKK